LKKQSINQQAQSKDKNKAFSCLICEEEEEINSNFKIHAEKNIPTSVG